MGSPQLPGYTREYDYDASDDRATPRKPQGFSYENQGDSSPSSDQVPQQSPSNKRATGLAFNYAPGQDDKIKKDASGAPIPVVPIIPVGAGDSPKDLKADTAAFLAAEQYAHPAQTDKPSTITPIAAVPPPDSKKTRIVKLYVITAKKDSKTGKVDAENGSIDISNATQNLDTRLIDSKYGLIDPSNGTVIVVDPSNGLKEVVQGHIDPVTKQLIITNGAVIDPATNRKDATLGQIISIGGPAIVPSHSAATVPSGKRLIKIVVITAKKDPKSGRIEAEKGHSETIDAILDPTAGSIESKYGLIDLKGSKLHRNNKSEPIEIDEVTNTIVVKNGVVDPKSGKVDSSLGQLITISENADVIAPVTSVTAKRDPATGQLDPSKAHKETTNAKINHKNNDVVTKYGAINVDNKKILSRDPYTNQITERPIQLDPQGNIIILSGVTDPQTGKVDKDLTQILQIGSELEPKIKVISMAGKVDSKKGLDVKNAITTTSEALYNPESNKIYTKYGIFDPIQGTLSYTDPKTGKTEIKQGYRDPSTNELLFKGLTNPKTGKADSSYGRTIKIEIEQPEADASIQAQPSSERLATPTVTPTAPIDSKSQMVKLMVITAKKDPKSGALDLENGAVDHSVGIQHPSGEIDSKYGLINPNDGNITIIDPATGRKEVVKGHFDSSSGQLIIPGPVVDPRTNKRDEHLGQVITIVGEVQKKPLPNVLASHPVPKKRLIKILIVTSKKDPKTGAIDLEKGHTENVTATVDPITGVIESKYGKIDRRNGKTIQKDPKTGKAIVSPIQVDGNSGQIYIKENVIDPKTGRLDPSLAQVVSIVEPKLPVVVVTSIIAQRDPKSGKVDKENGRPEITNGKLNPETGEIVTKQGTINLKLMRITTKDPKTGQIYDRPIQVDQDDDIIVASGVVNPATGKVDPNLVQVIRVGAEVDPETQVTTYVGKYDPKKNTVDNKGVSPETTMGLYDPEKNILHTKYGQIDPVEGTLLALDPKTGKQELKQGHIDTSTGDLIFKGGFTNPKTGKHDPHFARVVSVHLTEPIVDKGTEDQHLEDGESRIATKPAVAVSESPRKAEESPQKVAESPHDQATLPLRPKPTTPKRLVRILIITAKRDPKSGHIDAENGTVEQITGNLDPNSGLVETKYGLIDPKNGSISLSDKETIKGHVDPSSGQIVIPSAVDPKTGRRDDSLCQIITVVGAKPLVAEKQVQGVPNVLPSHPLPKKRVIKILVITSKKDPKTGRADVEKGNREEITATVDPVTGVIESKYGKIDPQNNKTLHRDPSSGKIVVTPIEVDDKSGQIQINENVVDPKTGKVDQSLAQVVNVVDPKTPVLRITTITAHKDPKTGKIDLAKGQPEITNGKLNPESGEIATAQGTINLKLLRIITKDPKTGEIKQRPIEVDKDDNIIIPTSDPNIVQVVQVGPEVDPEIQITSCVGKGDPKKNTVDTKGANIETTHGIYDPEKNKIYTKYGSYDPIEGSLTVIDPKTGKTDVRKGQLNPATGEIIFRGGFTNPKTGKVDPQIERVMTVKIVEPTVDSIAAQQPFEKTEKTIKAIPIIPPVVQAQKSPTAPVAQAPKVPPPVPIVPTQRPQEQKSPVRTEPIVKAAHPLEAMKDKPKPADRRRIVKILVITSKKDPKTGQVDAEHGQVEQISGIVDPQTGLVETKYGLINPTTGALVSRDGATGQSETIQGRVDPLTGSIHVTNTNVVDPETGKPNPNLGQVFSIVGLKQTPDAAPKKRIIKITTITTKIDPKTGKIDPEKSHVEQTTGALNPATGLIETKYGLIDPKNGKIIINDPKSGKVDAKTAQVNETTGQIVLTGGVIDPKTGKVDNSLGQIISVAGHNDPIVEVTTTIVKKDPSTGLYDMSNTIMETTKGKKNTATGEITTKYGIINLKLLTITIVDPKTGKPETKPIQVDPEGNIFVPTGVVDPKTDMINPDLGQIIQIGAEAEPEVQITTFVGKIDTKKNTMETKNLTPDVSIGLYNQDTHKIDSKLGQIDPVRGTLTYIDPKTGKNETKQGIVDPATGQILFKGIINPKTGKMDQHCGRVVSILMSEPTINNKGEVVKKDVKNVKIDPKTNQVWVFDHQDPITKQEVYSSGQIDPVTGYIITIYGYYDPKTGTVSKTIKGDSNIAKIDPDTNQVYTKTAEVDETGSPLYSVSEVDPKSGEIYTKYGKIDPKTGKLIIVRIYLISQSDPSATVREIDPKDCQIDEKTGKILKVTTQTVYMYSMVDPKTGKIIQVDPNDPLIKSANTKVTQVMTLSGEIDPETGKIHTEWGHIDPQTGDIDPATARRDPVTGELILNYAQIDPSHFTDLKDTKVKVTQKTYKTGGGDSSEAETSDDDLNEYAADNLKDIPNLKISKSKQGTSSPIIVKTTTKQIVTKDRGGVTQHIDERIEDGRTGEVTISKQVNKVSIVDKI